MRPRNAFLAALLALAAVPATASAACPGASLAPSAANTAAVEQATLCLVNGRRAAAGLPALARNAALDVASRAHSQDMVDRRFFGHATPNGVSTLARLTRAAYVVDTLLSWTVGENIAWGAGALAPPDAIVDAWMSSPHHRDNILDRDFEEIGVGVAPGVPVVSAASSGATYTTDFGARVLDSTSSSDPSGSRKAVTKKAKRAKRCPRAKTKKSRQRRAKARCVSRRSAQQRRARS